MKLSDIISIYLVRHGRTEANDKRLYCGRTDLPLSEAGITELIMLKNEGIYPAADIFFTSGLLRAEQTVDIIYGDVKRIAVPGIAEYNFGSFEMKSYEELKEQSDYQAWISDLSGDVACPGGESRRGAEKRIMEGYAFILNIILNECRAGSRSVFISCHGGTITSVMERLMPGIKNFYEWQPKPGRGYALNYALSEFLDYTVI